MPRPDRAGVDSLNVPATGLGKPPLLAEQEDQTPACLVAMRAGELEAFDELRFGLHESAAAHLRLGPPRRGPAEKGRAGGNSCPGGHRRLGAAPRLLAPAELISHLAIRRPVSLQLQPVPCAPWRTGPRPGLRFACSSADRNCRDSQAHTAQQTRPNKTSPPRPIPYAAHLSRMTRPPNLDRRGRSLASILI